MELGELNGLVFINLVQGVKYGDVILEGGGGGTVNWIRFNIQMATDFIQFVMCYASPSSYYQL